jgi:hypothetical protein
MHYANILDPVQDTLDPTVWDHPDTAHPKLKEHHRVWIVNAVTRVLEKAGYSHADQWLSLVLTGSLTTYQYSPESDVDVSLFVDVEHFPEWSRAEMISVMVEGLDGKLLPGTTHPMQNFVVPGGITREDLYQPGLRSGYDLLTKTWVVPPEKNRVHDVEKEMNATYVYAKECADKMDRLLKFDPDTAVRYLHMLHRARQRDQRAGKGDYSLSNIVYKFLAKKGLLPSISEVSGEYIASEKVAMPVPPDWLPVGTMPGDRITQPDSVIGYHDAPARFHQAILANGILPWDHEHNEGGTRYPGGYLQPRPGHVYMSLDHPGAHGYGASHDADGHVVYHVDLHKLNPTMINPDEDHLPDETIEGVQKTLMEPWGDFAERIGWGDNPDESMEAITAGRTLAHRGPIPPSAIVGWTHYMPSKYRLVTNDEHELTPNPRYVASTKVATIECPECHGRGLDAYGNECDFCQGFGHVTMNKFRTPPNRGVQMETPPPAWFHPVDPWMDNEPGTLTLPKHWSALTPWQPDPEAIEQARQYLGLQSPVQVTQVAGTSGQYMGMKDGVHHINVVYWLRPESASKQIWHEMTHAIQAERDPEGFWGGMQDYHDTRAQGHDQYVQHPWEVEARQNAEAHPFPLISTNRNSAHGSIQKQDQWSPKEEVGR